jgi:N-glycosylase/DNA lyase
MKNLVICLIMCLPMIAFSQDKKERKAAAEALKVQFITEELDLTARESEQFWPVFYLFEKEQKKIRKSIKQLKKSFETGEFSESDITTKLNSIKLQEQKLAELREKFILDCLPILGVSKTQKLVTIEEKLKRKIGDRIKERMDRPKP